MDNLKQSMWRYLVVFGYISTESSHINKQTKINILLSSVVKQQMLQQTDRKSIVVIKSMIYRVIQFIKTHGFLVCMYWQFTQIKCIPLGSYSDLELNKSHLTNISAWHTGDQAKSKVHNEAEHRNQIKIQGRPCHPIIALNKRIYITHPVQSIGTHPSFNTIMCFFTDMVK